MGVKICFLCVSKTNFMMWFTIYCEKRYTPISSCWCGCHDIVCFSVCFRPVLRVVVYSWPLTGLCGMTKTRRCVHVCVCVCNAPINVKPYYTPPRVHKGKVGIWQYKIWNPHPLGHTLLSNAPASLAYAMGFDNFEFLRMSKLHPWGNWLASNFPALPHYIPGGV